MTPQEIRSRTTPVVTIHAVGDRWFRNAVALDGTMTQASFTSPAAVLADVAATLGIGGQFNAILRLAHAATELHDARHATPHNRQALLRAWDRLDDLLTDAEAEAEAEAEPVGAGR